MNFLDTNRDFSAYNLACLRQVAEKMGPLCENGVFIGGTVLPLLTSGTTGLKMRKSKDVDMVEDFQSKDEIYAFEDQLWGCGFRKKSTGAVCRWNLGDIRIDILPADPDVVGFHNPWLRDMMRHAIRVDLEPDLSIRIMTPPYFLGAKFNAFSQRGQGDYLESHDVYDMLVLLAGRNETGREILESANSALREFLMRELEKLWEQTHELRDFYAAGMSRNDNGLRFLEAAAVSLKTLFST